MRTLLTITLLSVCRLSIAQLSFYTHTTKICDWSKKTETYSDCCRMVDKNHFTFSEGYTEMSFKGFAEESFKLTLLQENKTMMEFLAKGDDGNDYQVILDFRHKEVRMLYNYAGANSLIIFEISESISKH